MGKVQGTLVTTTFMEGKHGSWKKSQAFAVLWGHHCNEDRLMHNIWPCF